MVHSKLGCCGSSGGWSMLPTRLFAARHGHQHASQPCEHLSPFISPILPSCLATIAPSHQVYLLFSSKRGGWQVQFTEADLKTPLPPEVDLRRPGEDPGAGQGAGEAWGTSEARQMLEHAIDTGRGGIYLRADAGAVWEAEASLRVLRCPSTVRLEPCTVCLENLLPHHFVPAQTSNSFQQHEAKILKKPHGQCESECFLISGRIWRPAPS